MQIDPTELRAWIGTALQVIGAIIAGGLFLWRIVLRKLNAMGRSIRADLKVTADSCLRHDEKMGDHERRLTVVENDVAGAILSYDAVRDQTERVESEVGKLRDKKSDDDKKLERTLGNLESDVRKLLK